MGKEEKVRNECKERNFCEIIQLSQKQKIKCSTKIRCIVFALGVKNTTFRLVSSMLDIYNTRLYVFIFCNKFMNI